MYGLENIVVALVYLLYNPNLDSPLCSYLDFDLLDYQGDGNGGFEDKVRMYMRGEDIDGIKFSPDFLKQDQQQEETGIGDSLVKLGIDEKPVDTADECEGCTMMTVDSISWGDDNDMGETILVPREAAQLFPEINDNHLPNLTTIIDKDQGARNSIGRNTSQRRNNSAVSRLFDRLRQGLLSLRRFSLTNIFHRLKQSFIRNQ